MAELLTATQIAALWGVPVGTAHYRLRALAKQGVRPAGWKGQHRLWDYDAVQRATDDTGDDDELADNVVTDYLAGAGLIEVARRYHISDRRAAAILGEHVRPPGRPRRTPVTDHDPKDTP